MGRPKRKPDMNTVLTGENPFTSGFIVPVNVKARVVTNKYGLLDTLEQKYESTPFCKVFEIKEYKKKMMSLPIRSKELLLYLIHHIESGTDYIWIDRPQYMKLHGIKSDTTFRSAVNELISKSYICPVVGMKTVYWINPLYFFKGSRIEKYQNNVRTVVKKDSDENRV